MKHFYFFILLTAFLACRKDPSGPAAAAGTASIRVTAKKHYTGTGGLPQDSPLNHTRIFLYGSLDDRNADLSESTATTDTAGIANFDNLTLSHYWLKIVHPVFGVKLDDENTPPKTVSFVQIFY